MGVLDGWDGWDGLGVLAGLGGLEGWLPADGLLRDAGATAIALIAALLWLRTIETLAQRNILEQKLSRKIIHIGTGPLFVLSWLLFSDRPSARYFAVLVPLLITLQFFAIGLGLLEDPAAVQAMTRGGDRTEILRGPLFYGLVFILCTVVFWRDSPVGILALMMVCGGDGLADIVGRRFGRIKLPFSTDKSWAGSAAMFAGSFGLAFSFLALFSGLGYFSLALGRTAWVTGAIALAATLVEALPYKDIDNLTLTAVAIGLGLWLF